MRKKLPIARGKKKEIKTVKLSKLPFITLTFSFLLANIIVIIGVLLFQKNLPPEIPLNYGLPRSTKQLAMPLEIIIPLIISLLIIIINNILAMITENNYLKRVLIIASYFTTIMSIITVVKIVFLIGIF
ncbi:MAG TPA: hypothetical protein VI819_04220 [Patescibacteria group bacterium]|nr:hypothetical protein [Patescibacteria group bacterium]